MSRVARVVTAAAIAGGVLMIGQAREQTRERASEQTSEQAREAKRAAIDRYVRGYCAANRVPGMAIAVVHAGEVLHAAGYGRDSTGTEMTVLTPMPIASLSKSFTSLAVMQQVETGRVTLDAPVLTYLPDFRAGDPRGAAITVRHVLTHTSGLSDVTFPEKSGPTPASLEEGVRMLRTARLTSPPGARFNYHNPNYWIAARIVEVVSGQPFAAYLTQYVFKPLGMRETRTVGRLHEVPALARGHIRLFGVSVPIDEPAWFLDGASGIVTTGDDMSRWLMLHTSGGLTASGVRIVSEEGIRQMHAGLGWSVARGDGSDSAKIAGHPGWLFTATAHQFVAPTRRDAVAVMSSVGLGLAPVDSEEVARGVMTILNAQPSPPAGPPVSLIVDGLMAAATLIIIVFAVRQFTRAREWVQRRGGKRGMTRLFTLALWLIPSALLLALPSTLRLLFNGRDASYVQILYVTAPLALCLALTAAAGLAVVAARLRALRRDREG
jgi:CubicO group peptidase (beta-lactamase class C family)